MFWLADDEFAVSVPLTWERVSVAGTEMEETIDTVSMPDAVWRQKGEAHYLTFNDPSDPSAKGSTVLRLRPDQLVWTRFGDVTWNHTFVVGRTDSSILRMAGFAMDVRTETHHLEVSVGPRGGWIRLSYSMETGGSGQEVKLHLRFGEEAVE